MSNATDGLLWMPEARIASLCRVPRSTWQSWTTEGLIQPSVQGAYDEEGAITAVIVSSLRNQLGLGDAVKAWRALVADGSAERFIAHARGFREGERFDLVIEPDTAGVSLAGDDAALARAVRHPESPRPVIVVSLESELNRVISGFRTLANRGRRPAAKRAGRPSRSDAGVVRIRPAN